MNYQQITQKANSIVKECGAFIQEQAKNFSIEKVELKSVNQLVSYVDIETEKRLVQGLAKIIENAGFITEENSIENNANKEWTWIIDPLDGTTNFVHALPIYSISVALMHHKELVVGIVYEVNRDELFYAYKNGGAYLNEKRIFVSQTSSLDNSLIATGFPYYDFSKVKPYMECLDFYMQKSRGLRRLGSAAVDLAYVACGRFDAYFEQSLSPWDVAAGALLVQEAGGKVCDFNLQNNYVFGKEIIASNSNIWKEFYAPIQKAYYPK